MKKAISIIGASIVLAASSGFFVAKAVGQDPAPQKIVTITLKNGDVGPAGPTGPSGPQGEPGAFNCPKGFVVGEVIINHPGGHVTIYGCIDE